MLHFANNLSYYNARPTLFLYNLWLDRPLCVGCFSSGWRELETCVIRGCEVIACNKEATSVL